MTFLWKKWLIGILKRTVQAGMAYVGATKLTEWGLDVDAGKVAIALFAGLEALRSWLKHKAGVTFL